MVLSGKTVASSGEGKAVMRMERPVWRGGDVWMVMASIEMLLVCAVPAIASPVGLSVSASLKVYDVKEA